MTRILHAEARINGHSFPQNVPTLERKPSMKRLASIALIAVSTFAAPLLVSAASDAPPDATIRLSGDTVAVGVGYTHADGTLEYLGKSYPIALDGVSVLAAGASSFTATGQVYNLKKLDDINGHYAVADAGATVAGGGSVAAMKNTNGVVIKLRSTNEGLQLNLAVQGVSLKLTK